MLVAVPALVAMLWWLYRRESRNLSRGRRLGLVALRLVVLSALAAMLIEPVLITSRTETIRSRLALIFDDSESMRFADPYTDNAKAANLATALKIPADGPRSPVDKLRETPRLSLVKSGLAPTLEALSNGRDLYTYDLESALQGRARLEREDAEARQHQAQSVGLAAGRRLARCAGVAPGAAGRRLDLRDRWPVERRRRPDSSRRSGDPPGDPDLCHRRRSRRRAEECPPG